MTGASLGLNIRDAHVGAVAVHWSGKTMTVSGHAFVPVTTQTLADVLAQVKSACQFTGKECTLVLGPEHFSFRSLTLPFHDRRKIEQVLRFELDERTIEDIEEVLVDFLVTGRNGNSSTILAVLLPRQTFAGILEALAANDLQPKSIGVSGLAEVQSLAKNERSSFVFLDCGSSRAGLFLVKEGQLQLIRTVTLAPRGGEGGAIPSLWLTVKQTAVAAGCHEFLEGQGKLYLYGGRGRVAEQHGRAEQIEQLAFVDKRVAAVINGPADEELLSDNNIGGALAAVLPATSRTIDFLRNDFEPFAFVREYRRAFQVCGLVLAILCIGGAVYFGREYRQMSARSDQLKQEIETVFRQTVPEVTRIADPVRQLQIINGEIQKASHPAGDSGETMIVLLAELSRRIGPAINVQLRRLVADENVVRINGFTKDFNMVDKAQKELEKSPMFAKVEISSANQSAQGEEVRFELKLERTRR